MSQSDHNYIWVLSNYTAQSSPHTSFSGTVLFQHSLNVHQSTLSSRWSMISNASIYVNWSLNHRRADAHRICISRNSLSWQVHVSVLRLYELSALFLISFALVAKLPSFQLRVLIDYAAVSYTLFVLLVSSSFLLGQQFLMNWLWSSSFRSHSLSLLVMLLIYACLQVYWQWSLSSLIYLVYVVKY